MGFCDKCKFLLGHDCHAKTMMLKKCSDTCENWNAENSCCNCKIADATKENGYECKYFKPMEEAPE